MPSSLIRPAISADRNQVLALVPRLRAFGEAILRTAEQLDAGERRTLEKFFDTPSARQRMWVAEDGDGRVLGAALADVLADYFTQEPHGHLGVLMVAEEAAGRGVGSALLEVVEAWARDCGFRFLTLNVFDANESAQRFYRKAQFQRDFVRYIKPLTSR